MTQHGPFSLPPPPAPARFAALAIGVALGASALPGLWLTLLKSDPKLLFSALFEVLVLAAGINALLAGLGRSRDAWALALACSAGTVLVCVVFARLEVMSNFGDIAVYRLWIDRFAVGRLALAAGLAATASYAVFSRNPRSWGAIARAVAVLIPVLAVGVWLSATGGGPLAQPRSSPGAEAVRVLVFCLAGLVLIALISVGGHLVIRAFEHGRPDGSRSE